MVKLFTLELWIPAIVWILIASYKYGYRTRLTMSLPALIRRGRKAVCIGKNYRDHISELAQLGPEWKLEEEPEPVPSSAVDDDGEGTSCGLEEEDDGGVEEKKSINV